MSRLWAIIRMNLKLLLRNKGFLFFLCVVPVLSAIILNVKVHSDINDDETAKETVIELTDMTEKALYEGDNMTFIVKVYDASDSTLSDYILSQMASSGMFSICRAKIQDTTEEEVLAQAKKDAYDDRCGVLLFLKQGFEEAILKGNYEDALIVMRVSDDDRYSIFQTELIGNLSKIEELTKVTGQDANSVLNIMNLIQEAKPQKQIEILNGKDKLNLSKEQKNQHSMIGYALSFITLGFLFCGVFVAHTVIEEQENKVFTRVMLSKLSRREYFVAKVIIAVLISIVQTGILGISIFAVQGMDFGINKWAFLLIILCIGIVFSVLSLLLGVLIGDVMSSNYAVFAVWSMSSLLAGMYFPLKETSKFLQAVANLMPQRWYLDASELLMVGDKGAYSVILYVTVAYLIVFISIGSIGLKMKRSD